MLPLLSSFFFFFLFFFIFFRLVLLSNLPDSVFLKSNVYPALKYYLRRGDEGLCQQELEKLLSQLAVCGEEDREGGREGGGGEKEGDGTKQEFEKLLLQLAAVCRRRRRM